MVREEREKGWRSRAVDHHTEPGLKRATWAPSKSSVHNADALVWIILWFFELGLEVRVWKRDIARAFRKLPLRADHLYLYWVVWKFAGGLYAAQHYASSFGAVASVQAWHRAANVLWVILVRCARCPALKYVDDFFGASRAGLRN